MKNEFVPYDIALAMKELGFDEECFGWYDDISKQFYPIRTVGWTDKVSENASQAPLYQQAFRWFREKYNLLHIVNIDLSDNLKDKVYVYSIEDHLGSIVDRSEEFKTYEEAELECLRKLIEIVNQNKDENQNKGDDNNRWT